MFDSLLEEMKKNERLEAHEDYLWAVETAETFPASASILFNGKNLDSVLDMVHRFEVPYWKEGPDFGFDFEYDEEFDRWEGANPVHENTVLLFETGRVTRYHRRFV